MAVAGGAGSRKRYRDGPEGAAASTADHCRAMEFVSKRRAKPGTVVDSQAVLPGFVAHRCTRVPLPTCTLLVRQLMGQGAYASVFRLRPQHGHQTLALKVPLSVLTEAAEQGASEDTTGPTYSDVHGMTPPEKAALLARAFAPSVVSSLVRMDRSMWAECCVAAATLQPEALQRSQRMSLCVPTHLACRTVPSLELLGTCMPLAERGSAMALARQLSPNTGRVPFPNLLPSFTRLAHALVTLHAAGFIHGDIKLDNMLVDTAGDVQLADLGMATPVWALGEYDPDCMPLCTWSTRPPEWWKAPEDDAPLPYDAAHAALGDVWSFGITCLHWMTGNRQLFLQAFTEAKAYASLQKKTGLPLHDTSPREHARVSACMAEAIAAYLTAHSCVDDVPSEFLELMQRCCHPVAAKRPSMLEVHRLLVYQDVCYRAWGTATAPATRAQRRHAMDSTLTTTGSDAPVLVLPRFALYTNTPGHSLTFSRLPLECAAVPWETRGTADARTVAAQHMSRRLAQWVSELTNVRQLPHLLYAVYVCSAYLAEVPAGLAHVPSRLSTMLDITACSDETLADDTGRFLTTMLRGTGGRALVPPAMTVLHDMALATESRAVFLDGCVRLAALMCLPRGLERSLQRAAALGSTALTGTIDPALNQTTIEMWNDGLEAMRAACLSASEDANGPAARDTMLRLGLTCHPLSSSSGAA